MYISLPLSLVCSCSLFTGISMFSKSKWGHLKYLGQAHFQAVDSLCTLHVEQAT